MANSRRDLIARDGDRSSSGVFLCTVTKICVLHAPEYIKKKNFFCATIFAEHCVRFLQNIYAGNQKNPEAAAATCFYKVSHCVERAEKNCGCGQSQLLFGCRPLVVTQHLISISLSLPSPHIVIACGSNRINSITWFKRRGFLRNVKLRRRKEMKIRSDNKRKTRRFAFIA
jgi:hypothetical protein